MHRYCSFVVPFLIVAGPLALAAPQPSIASAPAPMLSLPPQDADLFLIESWYHQLANDDTRVIHRGNHSDWMAAASQILERSDTHPRTFGERIPWPDPTTPLPPFQGESLRSRQSPSVSDLLRDHALQLSTAPSSKSDQYGLNVANGARFAIMLYEWEPKGHDTLPTLQKLMQRCIDFQAQDSQEEDASDAYRIGGRIARLTVARLQLGDTAAAAEYGDWLRTVSPEYLGQGLRSSLSAFSEEPDNPAILPVADTLFSETGDSKTHTVWNSLMTDPKLHSNYLVSELFVSDMLRQTAFRELVLRRLSDTTEAGVVTQEGGPEQELHFKWKDGESQGIYPTGKLASPRQILRICDRVAVNTQQIAGIPRFDPLVSVAERDKECAAIAAYLKRYGAEFRGVERHPSSLHDDNFWSFFDYIGPVFSTEPRLATEADVNDNRAIFALPGKQVRLASDLPAPFPLEAEWRKDPNGEVTYSTYKNSPPTKHLLSHGYIWQAEEVFDGQKWVRYYGYVGPHGIARVPASEIVVTDYRFPQGHLRLRRQESLTSTGTDSSESK